MGTTPASSFGQFVAEKQLAAIKSSRPGASTAAQAAAAPSTPIASGPPPLTNPTPASLWAALGEHSPASAKPFLEQMRLVNIEPEAVLLACPPQSVTMASRVLAGPIGDLASKLLGRRVALSIEPDAQLRASMPAGVAQAKPRKIDPALLEQRQHPLVRRAEELLEARVIDVRPRAPEVVPGSEDSGGIEEA